MGTLSAAMILACRWRAAGRSVELTMPPLGTPTGQAQREGRCCRRLWRAVSQHHLPAGDVEGDPGDPRRPGRGEERRGGGDVFGLADAPEGEGRPERSSLLVAHRAAHLVVLDRGGGEAVDPDARVRVLAGKVAAERDHPG